MGVTPPILEKLLGPLAKGSRNTLSLQPQPYLNIVRIFTHPLPSITDFNIIDKDPSQITQEAKEAIHIRRLDPSLNRNIGKMSIPHCFNHLLGAKPKHPQVGALAAPQSVDEIAPPSQIPGLNLTQFNNIGNFRPNVAQHIPRPSTRACRARHLFNWSINWVATLQVKLFNNWHELSNVIPSSPRVWQTHSHVLELNCNSSPHHMTLIKDHWTTWKRCEDYLHSSDSLTQTSVKFFPL